MTQESFSILMGHIGPALAKWNRAIIVVHLKHTIQPPCTGSPVTKQREMWWTLYGAPIRYGFGTVTVMNRYAEESFGRFGIRVRLRIGQHFDANIND